MLFSFLSLLSNTELSIFKLGGGKEGWEKRKERKRKIGEEAIADQSWRREKGGKEKKRGIERREKVDL